MQPSTSPVVTAGLQVHYLRDTPERYDARLFRALDGRGRLELTRPFVETLLLDVPPPDAASSDDDIVRQALDALLCGFFGSDHPAPRIVGAPDWSRVSMEVTLLHARRARRLLQVDLAVDGAGTAQLARHDVGAPADTATVTLCPEDADPIYAITRHTLANRAVPRGLPATRHTAPRATVGALAA